MFHGSDRWASARLSLCSASLGVLGSGAAKLGLDDEWTNFFVERTQTAVKDAAQWPSLAPLSSSAAPLLVEVLSSPRGSWWLFWFFRCLFVLLQLALNGSMLRFFVRSMHASSSLTASTYNQVFSVLLAGGVGWLVLGERLSPSWFVGAAAIVLGVACVQWGNEDEPAADQSAPSTEFVSTSTITNSSASLKEDVPEQTAKDATSPPPSPPLPAARARTRSMTRSAPRSVRPPR